MNNTELKKFDDVWIHFETLIRGKLSEKTKSEKQSSPVEDADFPIIFLAPVAKALTSPSFLVRTVIMRSLSPV